MPELKLGLNDKMLFEATGRSTGSKGKGSRNGRHQVSSMCAVGSLRNGPDDQFHSARRRIRPHDVPTRDAREAADLGRSSRGARILAVASST